MSCCHFEYDIEGVRHVCNRRRDHSPPHIFDLFLKHEPVEPAWSNDVSAPHYFLGPVRILRLSRSDAPLGADDTLLAVSKKGLLQLLWDIGIDAGLDGRPNHAALNKILMDLRVQVGSIR